MDESRDVTSLLFAIQFLMISVERESAAAFFPTLCGQVWGIVDDANIRAKQLFGLFLADITVGSHVDKVTAPFWTIVGAMRNVLVSVHARKWDACIRRVRFQVEYCHWL